MEAHVIVHSMFCFTLLIVFVLHCSFVCLEGHSSLPHIPRFESGPPFRVDNPSSSLSTIYCLPHSPRSRIFPSFFNETGVRSSVASAKNNFSASGRAIFHEECFFLSIKGHPLQGRRLGGLQGCFGG